MCEGLALGGISAFLELRYPGIAIQAMGLTFGVTAVMLVLYTSGVVRATLKFTVGVIAATGGIFLVYMVDLVLGFFGRHVPLLNSSGPLGIGISVVIVIIAALNLILDFDFVETGVQAPEQRSAPIIACPKTLVLACPEVLDFRCGHLPRRSCPEGTGFAARSLLS